MSLDKCPLGKEVTITHCAAEPTLLRRLNTMGIMPGTRVTPLRSTHGNLVLCVYNGRLAIDKGLAQRISAS